MSSALFGWLIERYVLSFLYKRPLDTILATWGIGVMLQQAVRLPIGGELRYVEMPSALSDSTVVFGVRVSAYRIFIFFAALSLFGLTWLLMNRTTFGMKLRAIIQDRSIVGILRHRCAADLFPDLCLRGRACGPGRRTGLALEKRFA